MHLIQIVRSYLGLTQKELAQKANIMQADLCEMETKPPYGWIDKYNKLSTYLGISVHALVTNNCTLVPLSFFDNHQPAPYVECVTEGNVGLGRKGKEAAYLYEVEKLKDKFPALAKLVLPHYKLSSRPGYDILSFDEFGIPIYIEVKTSADSNTDFHFTKNEYQRAQKALLAGENYLIYRYRNFGCKDQKLDIVDFKTLLNEYEFTPATFSLCKKQDEAITGIRYYRELRGMSKGELADRLGIKTPDLWRYENGERRCPVGIYQRISSILDVTIDALISEQKKVQKNLAQIES